MFGELIDHLKTVNEDNKYGIRVGDIVSYYTPGSPNPEEQYGFVKSISGNNCSILFVTGEKKVNLYVDTVRKVSTGEVKKHLAWANKQVNGLNFVLTKTKNDH